MKSYLDLIPLSAKRHKRHADLYYSLGLFSNGYIRYGRNGDSQPAVSGD